MQLSGENRKAVKHSSSLVMLLSLILLFLEVLEDFHWGLELNMSGLNNISLQLSLSLSLSLFSGQAGEMWIQCMYISNDSCRYRFQTSSHSGQNQLHIITRPGIMSTHTHTHTHAFIRGHFRCYHCCITAPWCV